MEKLKALSAKVYKDQAVWFLNAYWDDMAEAEAENVWGFCNLMTELDEKNGKEGCEVDEFTAHRFLEKFEESMTVREMREILKEIDLDTNKNVSLAEYLIFKYRLKYGRLVNASQGDNKEEVDAAQAKLEAAQAALAAARNSAEQARKAEVEQQQAQAELKKALAQLEGEEKAYNDRISDLEKRSQEGGIVSRNKAKNELEQAKNEDPLPLRRAKINQQAAVRKAERATEEAKAKRADAEALLETANEAFKEAEEYLEEIKNRSGSGQGVIWWMNRELEESKKYLPQSKGGVSK